MILSSIKKKHKVLIINPYPIDADVPIGIMMGNLFAGFQPDEILQYHTQECRIDSKSKFKSKKVITRPVFINRIKKRIKSLLQNDTKITQIDSDIKLRSMGIRSDQWKVWLDFLTPSILEKEIFSEIKNFNPDIIYTQVYSYSMLKFVMKVSHKFSCPIIVHTLDDWMGSYHRKGLVSYIPAIYFNRKLKRVLNNGKNHMVASPKMKHYMEKKYGGKYCFVMNCSHYADTKLNERGSNPIKIVYTGGLMLERFLALDEVAKLLKSININEVKFEMHVYAPNSQVQHYRDKMQDNIVFHENIEHNDVYNVLINADVLIHVESFNPNVMNFTRYSLSTKIPEYLSSAKPLVYYGPQNIGVAEFLTNEKIGICIDSLYDLERELIKLYEEKSYYNFIGMEGFIKGKQLLSKNTMQEKLLNCLHDRGELTL